MYIYFCGESRAITLWIWPYVFDCNPRQSFLMKKMQEQNSHISFLCLKQVPTYFRRHAGEATVFLFSVLTYFDHISDLRSDHWTQDPALTFFLFWLQFFSEGRVFVKCIYSLLVL